MSAQPSRWAQPAAVITELRLRATAGGHDGDPFLVAAADLLAEVVSQRDQARVERDNAVNTGLAILRESLCARHEEAARGMTFAEFVAYREGECWPCLKEARDALRACLALGLRVVTGLMTLDRAEAWFDERDRFIERARALVGEDGTG